MHLRSLPVVVLTSLFAQPALASTGSPLAFQSDVDHVWTVTAAALVFLMQGGFLLLEAGQVRSKNSVNVAQKNLMDFIVSTVVFGAFGYMFMFGTSVGGWIGFDQTLAFFGSAGDWSLTFFVFQLMFCGTAATIMSGSVAERMSINGYLFAAVLIAAVIYPIAGHWSWGGLLNGQETPVLASIGFMDFAGSTVVHSVGAWVALAAIIVIGPRIGKFDENGKPRVLHGHSPVLATAGAILLWIGWIGFNGGSTLTGTSAFAQIIVNTIVAGGAGGLMLMLLGRFSSGFFRPDASINGVLGGLVAITAGADVMTSQGAFFIGLLGGLVVFGATWLLESVFKLDDPLGAIPVHGFAGAFGTLAIPYFAPADALLAGGRMEQFLVQLQGVGLVFVWAFGVAFVTLKGLDLVLKSLPGGGGRGLRVPEEIELEGLNEHEHDAPMGSGILQRVMAELATDHKGELKTITLDVGDDAYETSVLFNTIVQNIQLERDNEQARYEEDKARRMEVEAEIADVVSACVSGDFSHRLGLEGRSGFLLDLCRGINALSDTTENAITSLQSGLRAIAEGDLSYSLPGEYRGVMGEIQHDLSATMAQLRGIVDDVNSVVASASKGSFSHAVPLSGRHGAFLTLANGLNELCDVSERGLSEISETMKRVGAGDLTAEMSGDYEGRFAEIGKAVHRMNFGIGSLIEQITQTALDVSNTGMDLSKMSANLQSGAENQARAVQHSSGLVRSIEETARETAQQAEASHRLCQTAYAQAETGHDLTSKYASRMREIEETTKEITKSLELIEAIAKQTNLLSVNASVEAVRGTGDGDSNDGFKVVAGEVRSLAKQTSDAAKEIRLRTQAVQGAVAQGAELVQQSEASLTEIITAMTQSTQYVEALAQVGQKQIQGVEGLQRDFSTIENLATSNRALSDETANLSKSLDDKAAATIDCFGGFTLRKEGYRDAA